MRLQIFLGMRARNMPLAAVAAMTLIAAVTRAGAWPLAEELLRCAFCAPHLWHRLDETPATTADLAEGVAEGTAALLEAAQEARRGSAGAGAARRFAGAGPAAAAC